MDDNLLKLLRDLAFDLEDPDPERCPLSEIRDLLGDKAVPNLVEAIIHDDPVIRRTAALALGQLRSPFDDRLVLEAAVPHLEEMLETDPDPLVRLNAAEAIWFITGSKTMVPTLIEVLNHEDVEVRRFAVTMLGLVEAEVQDVLQPLTAVLSDSDPFVRATAAEVLALCGSAAAEALPHMERLLGEDEYTRVVAIHSILSIDPSRTEGLVPVLTRALCSPCREVRQRAAQVLGEIPTAGALAVPALVQALADEEEAVRLVALNTLQNLGPATAPAIPALIGILTGNEDILARGMAADPLGAIGPAAGEAVPRLLLMSLQEPGDDTLTTYFRLKVARALWSISEEPKHLLATGLETIRSPDWWLRGMAAAMLGGLGAAGRAVVPQLRKLLKDEHRVVRDQAARSLGRTDPAAWLSILLETPSTS